MTPTDTHLRVVILAGGTGSRFWPASTPARPKQLLPLVSGRPLVEETVSRALGLVPADRLQVVAGRHLRQSLTRALPDLPPSAFLWEPCARSTAPALAWATWDAWRSDPDAVVVSLHSDHLIRPAEAFRSLLRRGVALASRADVLLTVGAKPDRPETGYGYLEPGEPLDESGGAADENAHARRVVTFHEKPDASRAADYVRRGFLWNTGIFVWRAEVFLAELREHAPEIAVELERLENGDVEGFFHRVPSISVDEAVLERSRRCATLPASYHWDDIGSWEALARTHPLDGRGNAAVGDVFFVESDENIAYSESGPVVLFGVKDLVVVNAAGATMVTTREHARRLKHLVEALPPLLRTPPP